MTPMIPAAGCRSRFFVAVRAAVALAALAPAAARADVVHLKNGGTIACDSIEERGTDLVLRQAGGMIVVPRSEVARIERTAPSASPAPAAPSSGGKAPSATTPAAAAPSAGGHPAVLPGAPATTTATDPGEERRLADLRRRVAANPVPGDGSRRELVVLLTNSGGRALSERRYDDARRRFEEVAALDPAAPGGTRGLAAALIGLDQVARARSILEQALLAAPADPDLHRLLGEALARQDRVTEAIAAFEKAYALRPGPALRERIDDLRRHHGVEGDYRRAEAARFTVVYDRVETSPALEAEILPFLEGEFPTLSRLFDFVPRDPITVVVYPEPDFRHATQADANVAGLYDGKVRVPAGGRRLDGTTRAVLTHELAHAFIAGKSAGGAPRWLHEGLAQWAEGKRAGTAAESQLAREYRDSGGGPRWGTSFTYASALSFVEYLLARHGQHALNQVLAEIGRGADPESALESVTRESLADLTAAWGDDLVRRRLY